MLEDLLIGALALLSRCMTHTALRASNGIDVRVRDVCVSQLDQMIECLIHAVILVEVYCVSAWTCESVDWDIRHVVIFEFLQICVLSHLMRDRAVDAPRRQLVSRVIRIEESRAHMLPLVAQRPHGF